MIATIERYGSDISADKLIDALDREGCAIVERALPADQVAGLNRDLDELVDARDPGTPKHVDYIQTFLGSHTIRIDGLPGKSKTYLDVLQNQRLLAIAENYLKPHCAHYLLNTAQLIQICPGETDQMLHRDDQGWMDHPKHKAEPGTEPPLQVEAIYALSDFTRENGGTRVVPGSHRWPLDRVPEEHEIASAEMPVGSAIYYLGTTMHGGGANSTRDTPRRGLFTGFVVGWLRTEENFFLSTPIEAVREMPPRVQGLLGYDCYHGIGSVDVGSPRALL